MQYTIQNILLPDDAVCNQTRMYYRAHGSMAQVKNMLRMEKNSSCDFSAYFNSVSLNKWKKYTILDNLSLILSLSGIFKIELCQASWYKGKAITECQAVYFIETTEKQDYNFRFDVENGENLYFKITALTDKSIFYGGKYITEVDETKLNTVNIDLVMCTFKREKYVRRNIDLIVNSYIKNPLYNGSAHLKLKIVDNGQTLDKDAIEIPNLVHVYPNLNVGGSGGFCRGMIESLHEGTATHILFMDDDVLVQVESFERTYNLLVLLKDEYKKAFIGGAMLRLDQKNIQHENLAGFKGNYLVGLKYNLNLNRFNAVLFNEKAENVDKVYCAWWFCCIPVTVANLHNLPYPFFVRMDDIEYSIRNIDQAISLNGINVWHEAFDKKYSTLMENYFMFRNNLVTNMIHDIGGRKMNLKFLCRRFVHDIFRYDYAGAELLLDGTERVLEGPKFFQHVDTVKDLQAHGKKQLKFYPIENQKKDFLYGAFKADLNNIEENKLHKWIRFITWNGHFLPSMFFKNSGFGEYGYGNNSKMYFARKIVYACNPNFDNMAVLRIQRTRCIRLICRWLEVSWKLYRQYENLSKQYKHTMSEMISENFWHEYLHL